jgi:ribosomal protein S18 acetylase RimI-like enzyme
VVDSVERPRGARKAPRTGIVVREATRADLGTIVELRLALLRENASHPVYGRLRRDVEARAQALFSAQLDQPNETIFLAQRGRDVLGILRCVESAGSPLLHPSRYCYVSSVYVRPPARRAGILRALFDRATQWCSERGLDELRLHNIPSSQAASAAWDALGFEVVEHVRVRRIGPVPTPRAAGPHSGSSR